MTTMWTIGIKDEDTGKPGYPIAVLSTEEQAEDMAQGLRDGGVSDVYVDVLPVWSIAS